MVFVGVGADDADVLVRGIDDVGEYGAVVLAAVDGRIVVVGLAGDARGQLQQRIARNAKATVPQLSLTHDVRCGLLYGRRGSPRGENRSRHCPLQVTVALFTQLELRICSSQGRDNHSGRHSWPSPAHLSSIPVGTSHPNDIVVATAIERQKRRRNMTMPPNVFVAARSFPWCSRCSST